MRIHSGRQFGIGRYVAAAAMALAVAAPGLASADEPIDRELDKYWNINQKVESLQNPLIERSGGLEVGASVGLVPNDSYYLPAPVGGQLTYFLTDSIGVAVGGAYLAYPTTGAKSATAGVKDLQDNLECIDASGQACLSLVKNARQPPKMNAMVSADLVWVPFHGKVGIFDKKLSSFDLSVSAGVGAINAAIDHWAPPNTGAGQGAGVDGSQWSYGGAVTSAKNDVRSEWPLAAHWGAGFRFYVNKRVAVRLDYSQYAYKPGESWLAPVSLTAGASFLLR